MKRKGRKTVPTMLFWSRAEQRRFIDAVEKLVSTVNDLQVILAEPKRRAEAAAKTRAAREEARKLQQSQVDGIDLQQVGEEIGYIDDDPF